MAIRKLKESFNGETFKGKPETYIDDINYITYLIFSLQLPTEEEIEYKVKDKLEELLFAVEDTISDYQNATLTYESKKLSEGTKFNSTKFKKNCLIAEKAIDEIIDDNYDNVDDLTDGEATFVKNHFGSIITRCRKFLDDFGLTESNKKKHSKKLRESEDLGHKYFKILGVLSDHDPDYHDYLLNKYPDIDDQLVDKEFYPELKRAIKDGMYRIKKLGLIGELESINKSRLKRNLRESKLKEFDRTDYYAFAGATNFDDGSEPLICETDKFVVIVSGIEDGYDEINNAIVEAYYYAEDNSEYMYSKSFKTKERAVKIANRVIGELDEINSAEEFIEVMEDFSFESLN